MFKVRGVFQKLGPLGLLILGFILPKKGSGTVQVMHRTSKAMTTWVCQEQAFVSKLAEFGAKVHLVVSLNKGTPI